MFESKEKELEQLKDHIMLMAMAQMNHESIEQGGRPKFVSFQKDGET